MLEPIAYQPPPPATSRRVTVDRVGVILAWAVVWTCVAAVMVNVQRSAAARSAAKRQAIATGAGGGDARPSVQLRMSAKMVFGSSRLVGQLDPGQTKETTRQLKEQAQTPADRLAVAPVIAELEGPQPALAALKEIPAGARAAADGTPTPVGADAAALERIYAAGNADAVNADDRARLVDRLGFPGELALTFGKPPEDAARGRIVDHAQAVYFALLGGLAGAFLGFIAGLALLIIGITMLVRRRLRLRYAAQAAAATGVPFPEDAGPAPAVAIPSPPPGAPPVGAYGYGPPPAVSPVPPPPHQPAYGYAPSAWPPPPPPLRRERYHLGPLGPSGGRTGPFIEGFALFLLVFVGVPYAVRYTLGPTDLGIAYRIGVMFGALGLGLFWPRFRGVRWSEWRRGLGWTAPRGVFRELAAGLVGYLAGLPLLALAGVAMWGLNKLSGAEPSHPINDEFGTGGTLGIVLVYAAAAVWAPIVEETFFRGALFHRLRAGWGWAVSAVVSSFAFAAVHPQGWTAIPMLGAIAVVFCALREWRGSSLPGMAAHALHNGMLVTMMVVGGT